MHAMAAPAPAQAGSPRRARAWSFSIVTTTRTTPCWARVWVGSARRAAGGALIWTGRLGCFEVRPFDAGTNAVAAQAAELTRAGRLFSVAGGGDTLAALAHAGVAEEISYLSTAGGAFLEWLQGKTLPGVAALEEAAAR